MLFPSHDVNVTQDGSQLFGLVCEWFIINDLTERLYFGTFELSKKLYRKEKKLNGQKVTCNLEFLILLEQSYGCQI